MRFVLALLCFASAVVFFAPTQPKAAQKAEAKKTDAIKAALAEARKRLLKGNYEEARSAYEATVKKDAKLAPYAAIAIAESYRLEGNTEKAKTLLDDAKKDHPENPDVLAARANLLYELGIWDEAEKDADDAIAKKEGQLLARFTKARILRDRGKMDEADKAFRWVVRYYTARSNADDDITDPDELLMVAHCGAENARWHNLSKQFSFILNEVIKDILKADPDYWPAEVLAGQLLLEKYNRPDAIEAFDNALKINPKLADALAGKARAALVKYELKDADAFLEQALAKNPNHAEALRAKAELLQISSDDTGALKLLQQAKKSNPRDEQTLGRLAAVQFLLNEKPAFEASLKEVETFDPKPGVFYYELANGLEDRKRYTEAETYFKKAAELRPLLAGPRTGLGMLYLRLGNEVEGRKLLDAAYKADPFNVRVANSRKVLTHLDAYTTVTTEHYILKFDSNTDKILGEWIADYLEETHVDLKKQFSFEPEGKILIEVFNSHEMFSGRTVGLPDLHTIGACTGRVVAMASPKAKGLSKPFNWGRVIRHELTHIFNLAQTDYQVPHWITEGLAVRNENMKRSPQWESILRDRHASNTLLNLDNIMLAFVRPRTPDEWTLAYCQSQLYVEYLTKTYGEEAVARVMNAYRVGQDTTAALKTACQVEKAVFEKGYKTYIDGVVKAIQGGAVKKATPEKNLTFEELQDAVASNPDDDDLKARLADKLVQRNKITEAKKIVDELWERKPGHPGTALVRAKLLTRAGDEDGAKLTLEAAYKKGPVDSRILIALGKIYIEKKEYAEAAKLFEEGRKVAPLDSDWNEQLGRIYRLSGENEKLAPLLQELIGHDPDDLDARVRLAKIKQTAGEFAEAEALARDALLIDVLNVEAKDLLLAALRSQKKDAEVAKLEKRYAK